MAVKSTEERFWAKVWKTEGCWFWTASVDHNGYGQFRHGTRTVKAHRYAYETLVGPIPKGLEPDHKCRRHRCVNPADMELVTHRVNVLRGTAPSAIHARKTHCPNGHAYDEANTYRYPDGGRRCRTCQRAAQNRGLGQGHNNAIKTHCPQGHEYTPENTYVLPTRPNARYCRACQRIRVKERATRKPPAS